MLKDRTMFRSRIAALISVDTHSWSYNFKVNVVLGVFSRVRDLRATCHTLRLSQVQGNRQSPCGRIASCSGALRVDGEGQWLPILHMIRRNISKVKDCKVIPGESLTTQHIILTMDICIQPKRVNHGGKSNRSTGGDWNIEIKTGKLLQK